MLSVSVTLRVQSSHQEAEHFAAWRQVAARVLVPDRREMRVGELVSSGTTKGESR